MKNIIFSILATLFISFGGMGASVANANTPPTATSQDIVKKLDEISNSTNKLKTDLNDLRRRARSFYTFYLPGCLVLTFYFLHLSCRRRPTPRKGKE